MVDENIRNAIKKLKIEEKNIKRISKIGEGAWHSVFKIECITEEDIVIRIKKKKAYEQVQEFKELDLKTEYESSKVYYELANQCSADICPSFFKYILNESLVFTVETFMGEGKRLHSLDNLEAYSHGKKLGDFFQAIHKKNSGINGFGNLMWNGKHLEGSIHQDVAQIWKIDNDFYVSVMNDLIATDLEFNREIIVKRILSLIQTRRKNQQSISLVNQDVTPENIIFNPHNVSLIDPFPMVRFRFKICRLFCFLL